MTLAQAWDAFKQLLIRKGDLQRGLPTQLTEAVETHRQAAVGLRDTIIFAPERSIRNVRLALHEGTKDRKE